MFGKCLLCNHPESSFNILKQKIHNYCNILYIGSETYVIILDMAI